MNHFSRVVAYLSRLQRRTFVIYRVIRKSVKHFKNSQQINAFGNTADIYAIVHLVPHACQHITVDQSHSRGDTVVKIWRLAGSGGTKTVSFTNRQKKMWHRVKSGDGGGYRINASSSFPVLPIHLFGKFRLRYPRTSLW